MVDVKNGNVHQKTQHVRLKNYDGVKGQGKETAMWCRVNRGHYCYIPSLTFISRTLKIQFSLLTLLLLFLRMWIQIKLPIIITTLCRDICFLFSLKKKTDSGRRQRIVSHADGPFVWLPWSLWGLLPTDVFLVTKQPSDGEVCHWRKWHCPRLQHDLDCRSVDESRKRACWVWFTGQENNVLSRCAWPVWPIGLIEMTLQFGIFGSVLEIKTEWTNWGIVF